MTGNRVVDDARVAGLLADVPAFTTWHNRPLTRQLRQLIGEMDEQMLMSLTAYSLHRLMEGATADSRGPLPLS